MTPADAKRRLLWHGMLIFGLGLLTGAVVPVMTNPRMGVAAHAGGVMSGMLLLLVGVIWGEIKLSASMEKACTPQKHHPTSRSNFFQPILMMQAAEDILDSDPARGGQLMPLILRSPYGFPFAIWNTWP